MTDEEKGVDVIKLIEQLQQAKLQDIQDMSRRAQRLEQANEELQKEKEELQATISSMQSASNAVRLKLATMLVEDHSEDVTWSQITSGVRGLHEVIKEQQRQIDILVESLSVMRQRMTKAREVIRPYLPPDLQNIDSFDPAEEFQKIVERLNNEVDSLHEDKKKMREDANYDLQDAEARVREWRAHLIELAKAVGVPSNVCGTTLKVNLDYIMNYVNQTMPAYKLLHRMNELEKGMEERFVYIEDRFNSISFKPAPEKKASDENNCPVCGNRNPKGVVFCPCCSTDLMEVCLTCVHGGESCTRNEDGSCDHYEGRQKTQNNQ